jgi:hypothetical protein
MFILQVWNPKDVASKILLIVIVAVAIWIAALPLSSTVQESYLRRFHLASPNFAVWAIQQPVPAMYNFENRVWASPMPATFDELYAMQPDPTDSQSTNAVEQVEKIETDSVNHFPTRAFTFGDSRSFLKQNPSWYFYLRSRYRDLEIRSGFQISPVSETEVQVNRLEVTVE